MDQETRTEVGLRKVTVIFSGTPGPKGIEPEKKILKINNLQINFN